MGDQSIRKTNEFKNQGLESLEQFDFIFSLILATPVTTMVSNCTGSCFSFGQHPFSGERSPCCIGNCQLSIWPFPGLRADPGEDPSPLGINECQRPTIELIVCPCCLFWTLFFLFKNKRTKANCLKQLVSWY